MAVFPVAPGHPDYASNGASKYIPAVYSALLIKKFYPMCVTSKISNTDYEGDIKDSGDTVYIRTRPTIETFKYKKGMVLPVQNPESPYVTLKIDQGEGFSFAIDKVDEFQADINLMNTWADDASEQMKQVLDRNILTTIAGAASTALSGAPATNIGGYTGDGPTLDEFTIAKGALVNGALTSKGSTVVLGTDTTPVSLDTGDEITAQVLKYGRYLDENNCPDQGRFVIMPTWMGSILKSMASNNFGLAYATGQNTANLLAGSIPKLDRFEIIFTNNMPLSMNTTIGNEDASPIFFGTKYATTFATQITESRIIDNPFSFGKMMQGLQVYGFNVIKPPFLGVDFGKNA